MNPGVKGKRPMLIIYVYVCHDIQDCSFCNTRSLLLVYNIYPASPTYNAYPLTYCFSYGQIYTFFPCANSSETFGGSTRAPRLLRW